MTKTVITAALGEFVIWPVCAISCAWRKSPPGGRSFLAFEGDLMALG
jgi:hypothetical protein